jgi:hypothetical protein
MYMTSKQSIAKKKYWANKTPEERSARGSAMAKGKWKKMSAKQRSEYARKIINIRWSKLRQ